MTRSLCLAFPVVAMLAAGPLAKGDELLPPDRPIAEAVDTYVDARLREAGVSPAAETDDAGLLRRLSLDLVGRIPTEAETRAYLDSTAPDKRVAVVDRMIAAPGFVRHQANELDAMMMAGTRGSLRDYLISAFKEDRAWDQVFRDVVLAEESEQGKPGAGDFLKQRVKDLDRLTNDVSTTFFGVNVSCAKCHDHPRVPDWKQDHFYGMKSFFARTYQSGQYVGEYDYGSVKFQTTKGQERQARAMFLTGRVVEVPSGKEPSKEEQRAERKRLAEASKNKKAPPPPRPKFSARAQLVEVALQPGEREFFSRAIVNRLWHRLFGTGLVMPLDQMHSANPPSHPELLAWLARDIDEHGYNLRRVIRGLVLSKAYARSSRWESAGDSPDPRLFAVAAVRPLTPVQLATSMWVAATDPAVFPAELAPDALEAKLQPLEDRGRSLAGAFGRPGDDYQIGAAEALLLSNSSRTKDLLADDGERLVARMLRIEDRQERAAFAVRNVLSRPAEDEEVSVLAQYLEERADRPAEACRQLVWALLTSAEFRFNH